MDALLSFSSNFYHSAPLSAPQNDHAIFPHECAKKINKLSMNRSPFSGNETAEEFADVGFVRSKRRLKIAILSRQKEHLSKRKVDDHCFEVRELILLKLIKLLKA